MVAEAKKSKVLAVASEGGHWEQLMLLRDVFDRHDVVYVTTNADLISKAKIENARLLPDCNRNTAFSAARSFARALKLVWRERPDYVISTGALPGLFCLVCGNLVGARTIWLDSVANVEKMSMCGNFSRYIANLCLTQWEHLAQGRAPQYIGSVL